MTLNPLCPFFDLQDTVILDGGLATELEVRGSALTDELWSARLLLERPEAIRDVHYDYLAAGADCITSASYQATIPGFARRGIAQNVAEDLLRLSVNLACEARDAFWRLPANRGERLKPLVAASVGPYGAFLADGSEYTGDYGLETRDDQGEGALMDFHRRRLEVLSASDADLLALETIPARVEALALVRLLGEVPGPPAWLSFCCRDARHLSDGSDLAASVEALDACDRIVAFGVNCVAPQDVASLIERLRGATTKPIAVYPNSGESWDASDKRWGEQASPADLAAAAARWHRAGARLIGGCCRTGPDEIRGVRARLLGSVIG